MPHPFFESMKYPWPRKDARAFHEALYEAIEPPATIRMLYKSAGGEKPLRDDDAMSMWQEALNALTTARRLEQLCILILERPALAAIHDVVRAVQNAEGTLAEVAKSERERIAPYALLSLGSFAGGALVVLLLGDEWLGALGIAIAGFLFGALRSFAIHRGKHFGGALEIGVPIAGFALVLIGGSLLWRPASNFPLTVYVHGPAGADDIPLRNEGAVLLDLGGERRRATIGEQGQAFFLEIPASFRGEKVNVALESSAFQRADNSRLAIDGPSLYLKVQRKPARIGGSVQDGNGNRIAGATVSVAGLSVESSEQGRFDLVVSPDLIEDELLLRVSAEGYQPWTLTVVPNGGEITAVMQR